MNKLHVCLCSYCINDLKNYNPYVDKNNIPLSLDQIEIEEVNMEKCYNCTINGEFVNERRK